MTGYRDSGSISACRWQTRLISADFMELAQRLEAETLDGWEPYSVLYSPHSECYIVFFKRLTPP